MSRDIPLINFRASSSRTGPLEATFKLKYDTPKSGEGANGPWHLYTVDVIDGDGMAFDGDSESSPDNGSTVKFFASEKLHESITQAGGTRRGVTLTVTREGERQATRWDVQGHGGAAAPAPSNAPSRRSEPRRAASGPRRALTLRSNAKPTWRLSGRRWMTF